MNQLFDMSKLLTVIVIGGTFSHRGVAASWSTIGSQTLANIPKVVVKLSESIYLQKSERMFSLEDECKGP